MRVSWTARRSNQSILKESSPECSLERLMLKLKLQYFGHLMQRADSFEKTLMLGKIEGRRSPLQCFCLGNPMERGIWWATAHGDAKQLDMIQRLNKNKKAVIGKYQHVVY